jgi:DNA-binding GntR family transcriptional regulator
LPISAIIVSNLALAVGGAAGGNPTFPDRRFDKFSTVEEPLLKEKSGEDRRADDAGGGPFVPMGQLIAGRLREAILAEELPPGAHIRQAPVAAEFGTSRIPVREALAQLETEGLVTLIPHSGARVAQFDFGEHVELYRIRELLEPLAAAESARHLDDEGLADLRQKAEEVERSTGDLAGYLRTDREFHFACYSAAEMPQLLEMIDSLWNQTTHYRRAYLRVAHEDDHDLEHGFLEHKLLIDSLAHSDSEAAADIIRMHLRRTRIRITEHAAALQQAGGIV